jgi:ankyrin repeat protein
MIKPAHFLQSHQVELPNGAMCTSDDVWDMLKASNDGDLARVEALLGRCPGLATCEFNYTPPLHFAVREGHVPIVRVLLAHGADPSTYRSYPFKDSLLTMAEERGFEEIAQLLREKAARAPVNVEDSSDERPITAAARRNDLETVKLLLEQGADPNLPEKGAPHGSALWVAVYQRQPEMITLLLQHGATPNASVDSGGSVMEQAYYDPALVRQLVEHGAPPPPPPSPEDALRGLKGAERLAAAKRVLQEHPEVAHKRGILSDPARSGERELVELLLQHGARVEDVTLWARWYYFKHYDIAKLLLERQAISPNHISWQRVTLLHDMAHEGDLQKVTLLLDHGADINAIDGEYRSTPLGIASRWGNRNMVRLLLARGADPNQAGAAWATPLAWAHTRGHADVASDLQHAGAR